MLLIKKACIKKFQNVVIESNHKPNKICVDKISEFYNRTLNSWLQYNEIEIYSKNNEGTSVVSETFIKLYDYIKVYEYRTAISKEHIRDNFPEILKQYRSIKMKPDDFKPKIYMNISVEFRRNS